MPQFQAIFRLRFMPAIPALPGARHARLLPAIGNIPHYKVGIDLVQGQTGKEAVQMGQHAFIPPLSHRLFCWGMFRHESFHHVLKGVLFGPVDLKPSALNNLGLDLGKYLFRQLFIGSAGALPVLFPIG
ncbi:MAG: hypothetical protein M0Z59_01985 [Nitrospiraceae bacterium]|nr:hypothetical protein [Nitrospiraceae bacterium]